MSWDKGGNDSWNAGDGAGSGSGGGASGDNNCRICGQEGHYARECPDKPEGGGLTGECFNCGEVGHNKADCPNPRADRPFTGTCNVCGVEGHSARNCPDKPVMTCRLCGQEGHKALECKERRLINWTGVPEMSAEDAWVKLVDAANERDLDAFRTCLKAYARALGDGFNLKEVAIAMRDDELPIYLIAFKQEVALNMTIVDLLGNPGREFVLSLQFSEKPRRVRQSKGWPETPEINLERLLSAGFVQDCGSPLCSNCGTLGHIRKHCKEEVPERESTTPTISCVYCHEVGHRARDCPKERINPFACKNCKQEGHNAKDCPEPRSAENVECRKCNQIGHFSRDCLNVEARTCRNCGSTEHIAKECDQPRNPDTVTCRNCEKQGHFSRDCPEPKDWSKVQCSNCQGFGHTFKRCKVPATDGDAMGSGGAVETSGGWDNVNAAASGNAGGEANWGSGGGGW